MRLLALSLVVLLAACSAEDRQVASGDSPRCEVRPGAPGCGTRDRVERPRPDDNWRTSGFGGY